ncbi:MAG: hypothetical protein PHN56_02105 [Candidatus Nanoarchaeia archaeon]|nr:hypothetical protein [Candidatus Nanoarchaeia archaeon]
MIFFRSRNKRVLIKIGTDSITDSNLKLLRDAALNINEKGSQVIIVTSGAKALGEKALKNYNLQLSNFMGYKQLCCATGQHLLMQKYDNIFGEKGYIVQQYLITSEDLDDACKKQSFISTMECNLKVNNLMPIINYNDSLAKYELERVSFFSDNDRLSATVAHIMNCDLLILLTKVGGIFRNYGEKNNSLINTLYYKEAKEFIKNDIKSDKGTGGMASKIEACEIFKNDVLITNADNLVDVLLEKSSYYTLLKYFK